MRRSMLCALVLSLAASASALTPSTGNVFQPEQKPWNEISRQDGVRVQGDTVEDPFIISAFPCTVSGNTCSFINDYDCACPYTGSTSADVVFKCVVTENGVITVDLCGSSYDTKVYIFENTVDNVIACNDDYCSWQSGLFNIPVLVGNSYYIVVDGYGGSCGAYNMVVWGPVTECHLECPAGAMLEGEPTCYDGYNDTYNGGCNVVPFPVFQVLSEWEENPIVICGTTGVFQFDTLLYRDTDWFQMDVTMPSYVCLSGDAEVPCYFLIIDGRGGCSTAAVVAYGIAGPCAPVSDICYQCDPGTWWAWAGPNGWDTSFACGSIYIMSIWGYAHDGSPVESTTWGRVKGLFR